jgi:hypothetical protein
MDYIYTVSGKKLNTNLTFLLEKVKAKYPFSIVHSKDCDNLATDVLNSTGERISGSTIKRLFGFIKTTSNPNKFTLNVLARYVGYQSYLQFVAATNHNSSVSNDDQKHLFIEYVKQGSFTDSSKWHNNEAGLDFLNHFIDSDYDATALISEKGNGKSVLLAQFLQTYADNCFVLWGGSLRRKDVPFSEQLKQIDIESRLVVIDGLEETAYNFTEIRTLFQELNKYLSFGHKSKIIITVSPYTWGRVSDVFPEAIKKKWFRVQFNPKSSDQCVNVRSVLHEMLDVDDPINLAFLSPFYLELVKKVKPNTFINEWDLLMQFFKEKVWDTSYAFEKKLFFERILELTDNGKNGTRISRKEIQDLILKYKKAHIDLVSYNILKEEKELNKFGAFSSYYSFGYHAFYDYLIVSGLLDKHNGFTSALIAEINENYEGENKLNLLKLSVSYALREYDTSTSIVFDADLIEIERQALMIHIAYQIRFDEQLQQTVFPAFVKSENGRKYFIERWIDEEHLNGFYGEGLKQYLNVVTDPQDLIFANALLYYNAFLQNDDATCKERYKEITQVIHEQIHPFVLGRKYMTKMLEEFRLNGDYNGETLTEVENNLNSNLKEGEDDLPVHNYGFEHNILHAEFLTGHYHFTERLLQRESIPNQPMLHPKDSDSALLQIFNAAFYDLPIPELHLEGIHPWYRYTVENYLARLIRK